MTDNINRYPVCKSEVYKYNKMFSKMLNLLNNRSSN